MLVYLIRQWRRGSAWRPTFAKTGKAELQPGAAAVSRNPSSGTASLAVGGWPLENQNLRTCVFDDDDGIAQSRERGRCILQMPVFHSRFRIACREY